MILNFPQILAAIIVLSLHWHDPIIVCDVPHEIRWRIWSTFATIRMSIYSVVVISMYLWKSILDDHPRLLTQVSLKIFLFLTMFN